MEARQRRQQQWMQLEGKDAAVSMERQRESQRCDFQPSCLHSKLSSSRLLQIGRSSWPVRLHMTTTAIRPMHAMRISWCARAVFRPRTSSHSCTMISQRSGGAQRTDQDCRSDTLAESAEHDVRGLDCSFEISVSAIHSSFAQLHSSFLPLSSSIEFLSLAFSSSEFFPFRIPPIRIRVRSSTSRRIRVLRV